MPSEAADDAQPHHEPHADGGRVRMIQRTVQFTDGELTLIGEAHDNDMSNWDTQCDLCDERDADVVALEKDFAVMDNPLESDPINLDDTYTGIALYGAYNDNCEVAGFDDRTPLIDYMQQHGYNGTAFPNRKTFVKYLTSDDVSTLFSLEMGLTATDKRLEVIAKRPVARHQLDIYNALYNKREQAMIRNLLGLIRNGNTVVASVGTNHFPVLIEALSTVSDIEPTTQFDYPDITTAEEASRWCTKQEQVANPDTPNVAAD